MDTLTKSCSLTIVITANGEVQTHEEATVYVKEMDIFLTLKVLENTPSDIPEWLQEFREKFWWMTEFLNAETHTPVLLMNYL